MENLRCLQADIILISIMSSNKKESDYSQLKKYNCNEEKWYKWSSKTLAYTKCKGFKQVFMKNMTSSEDLTYKKTIDKAI